MGKRVNGTGRSWLLGPVLTLLAVIFVAPLLILFCFSVAGDKASLVWSQIGWRHYARVVTDSFYRGVVGETLLLALSIGVISLLITYPLAYFIARHKGNLRGLMLALVITPLLTNQVVRTIGWQVMLADHGPLNQLLLSLHLLDQPLHLLGTRVAIIIALVHIFTPFMALPLISAIENIDPNLEEAARGLGANWLRSFVSVVLPLSAPGAVAGFTLVLLLSLASYVTPRILGEGKVWVMSTLTYQQIQLVNWPLAGALAFTLLAMIMVVLEISGRVSEAYSPAALKESASPGRWQSLKALVLERVDALVTRSSARRVAEIGPAKFRPSKAGSGWVLRGYSLLMFAFLLSPMVVVVASAFSSSQVLGQFEGATLKWFRQVLANRGYLESAFLSLRLSLVAATISLLFGGMACLYLMGTTPERRRGLSSFLTSPLTVPTIVTAVALVIYFHMLRWPASFARLAAVHALLGIPYTIRTMLPSFVSFDRTLEEAALGLGARPWQVVRHIILPLVKPALISAFVLGFLVSFDEVVLTLLVGGSRLVTLPVRVYMQVEYAWEPAISAISSCLMVVTAAAVLLLDRTVGLKKLKL